MSAFSSDAFAAYCPSRTCASPSSSSCTWGAIYQQAAEALASVGRGDPGSVVVATAWRGGQRTAWPSQATVAQSDSSTRGPDTVSEGRLAGDHGACSPGNG
eukprot:1065048-Prorocentrum_minimum.AAC.2